MNLHISWRIFGANSTCNKIIQLKLKIKKIKSKSTIPAVKLN